MSRCCPYCDSEVSIRSVLSTDQQIIAFALNLEYLEVEYYGLHSKVKFSTPALHDMAEEIFNNEKAHVAMYQDVLGKDAVGKPVIDVQAGLDMAALAAGLIKEKEHFDPLASQANFFLGGMLIEDVGVTAYTGALGSVQDESLRNVLAGVLACEAHHMGFVRSFLCQSDGKTLEAANQISEARNKLDDEKGLDQPVVLDGKFNFVPSDKNGVCFRRTPKQVLKLVTGGTQGGFFPEGLSGEFPTILG